MTFVDRSAYTVIYVCTGAVYAVWDPVVPLKAMAGMPSFEASVAAPTVPDTRTVLPRLAKAEAVRRDLGSERIDDTPYLPRYSRPRQYLAPLQRILGTKSGYRIAST